MLKALTEDVSQKINRILTDLLEQVEAEAVFLCDRGGNILAHQAHTVYPHEENIGALAAGSFFATVEMARLVGEPKFRCLIHQGEITSIYMEGLDNDLLLVVVFSKDSNPGLVKLHAKDAIHQLADLGLSKEHKGPEYERVHSVKLEIDESAQPFTNSLKPRPH